MLLKCCAWPEVGSANSSIQQWTCMVGLKTWFVSQANLLPSYGSFVISLPAKPLKNLESDFHQDNYQAKLTKPSVFNSLATQHLPPHFCLEVRHFGRVGSPKKTSNLKLSQGLRTRHGPQFFRGFSHGKPGWAKPKPLIRTWTITSWCLNQPIWKILVKLDHFPRGENKKCLKSPPKWFYWLVHGIGILYWLKKTNPPTTNLGFWTLPWW